MQNLLLSVNHTRIEATDILMAQKLYKSGHIVTNSTFLTPGTMPLWKMHKENTYTWAELATSISHTNAIRKAYDNGDKMALILEDDVTFDLKDQGKIRAYIETAPKDWDVLQLYIQNMRLFAHNAHLIDPWLFWQSHSWGATAYVINRKGMRSLLEKLYDGRYIFNDNVLVADELVYYFLNAYSATRFFFNTLNDESQIQKDTIWKNRANVMQYIATEKNQRSFSSQLFRIAIIVRIDTIQHKLNVLDDREFLLENYRGTIVWHVMGTQASMLADLDDVVWIQHLRDVGHFDFVTMKHGDYRITGMPWNTLVKKSCEHVISGVLMSHKRHHTIAMRHQKNPNMFDFRNVVHSFTKTDVTRTQNRGSFTKVVPIRVDYVESDFSVINGSFFSWFIKERGANEPFGPIWCGAAYEWGRKEPCAIVPIGIPSSSVVAQAVPNITNKNKKWVEYSAPFVNAFLSSVKKNMVIEHASGEANALDSIVDLSFRNQYKMLNVSVEVLEAIVVHPLRLILFLHDNQTKPMLVQMARLLSGCSYNPHLKYQWVDLCLTYLSDYDSYSISRMMTDLSWTKSIFLRDPHERLVYEYLQQSVHVTFETFARQTRTLPTFQNMEFLQYINFVASAEHFQRDVSVLLQRLNIQTTQKITYSSNTSIPYKQYYSSELWKYVTKKNQALYKLKMLDPVPQIMIVGAQKSGTTALKVSLEIMEEYHMDTLQVYAYDDHFLEKNLDASLLEYSSFLSSLGQHKTRKNGTVIVKNANLFHSKNAPPKNLPRSTKIIIILREPSERFYSAFKYYQRRNGTYKGKMGTERYADMDINECILSQACKEILRRGQYIDFLEAWWNQYDNVFIDFYENIWYNDYDWTKLQKFIGMRANIQPLWFKVNHDKDKIPMSWKTKKTLTNYYATYNTKLCNWLKRKSMQCPAWTKNLNKIPNTIIVGAQKAGTRALLTSLEKNTEIQAYRKEIHYFDKADAISLSGYISALKAHKAYHNFSRQNGIVLEKTPRYILGPKRMRKVLPSSTKIIILLRDPTERFFSHIKMKKRKDSVNLSECFLNVPNRYWSDVEGAMNRSSGLCSANNNVWSVIDALYRGQYINFVPAWTQNFQYVFIDYYERMWKSDYDWTRLQKFIGIDARIEPIQYKVNHDKSEEVISYELKQKLDSFYEEANKKFCTWTQRLNIGCLYDETKYINK